MDVKCIIMMQREEGRKGGRDERRKGEREEGREGGREGGIKAAGVKGSHSYPLRLSFWLQCCHTHPERAVSLQSDHTLHCSDCLLASTGSMQPEGGDEGGGRGGGGGELRWEKRDKERKSMTKDKEMAKRSYILV